MKTFRTFNLAVEFFHLTQTLTIRGALKDQLYRAASSVALNLAEGRGKGTTRDQKKFFHIALGSIRECQAILILEKLENTQAWRQLDNLAAHTFCLIKRAG